MTTEYNDTPEFDLIDGEIRQINWTTKDTKEFLSDFCDITDRDSITRKWHEIVTDKMAHGLDQETAEIFAGGYEKALLDIYHKTK